MKEAEEGELYMQHSFSHWVLMRLHISSRKDIYRRIKGIFAMGRTSGFTKELLRSGTPLLLELRTHLHFAPNIVQSAQL